MKTLSRHGGTAKCPECGGTSDPTGWLPIPGNDPMMREFICRDCHYEFYYIVPDGEQLIHVRERVKALQEAGELQNDFSKTG